MNKNGIFSFLLALFTYRTNQNSITKHEPFFLTYGWNAKLLIELKIPAHLEEDSTEEEKLIQWIYHIVDQLSQQILEAKQNIEEW